jgi:hypothetical protein
LENWTTILALSTPGPITVARAPYSRALLVLIAVMVLMVMALIIVLFMVMALIVMIIKLLVVMALIVMIIMLFLMRSKMLLHEYSVKKYFQTNPGKLFKWGFFKRKGHLVNRFAI